MSLVLWYTKSDGSKVKANFSEDASIIDLSNRDIVEFDASQLMDNDHIKELRLDGNRIPRFDLTPLKSCNRLKKILLDDSTEGETLLRDSTMEKLSKPVLYDKISNFESLSNLPSLNSVIYTFSLLKRREPKWKLIHLFLNSLYLLGLGWMGNLDIGIKSSERLLKHIAKSGYNKEIQNTLMTALKDQIDRGGSTINLDVEEMKKYGDLVMRIDDVVELRTEEMKGQFVPVLALDIDRESIEMLESEGESVDSHYADLRMLWLTAYGYEVLESLAMRTTCEMKVFTNVQKTLKILGFDIETRTDRNRYKIIGWRNRKVLGKHGIKSPEPKIVLPDSITSEMIEYIWQLAEYRNGKLIVVT
ncbi:MAG: hypothetical protein ACXAAO_11635 [Candidatus Thorarchaeota archaeon]